MKKVSVIMPAYNAEKFIGEAIESVVNQTYVEWNLIIYNDGSTDRTKEIINDYVNSYYEKIRMIDGIENKGTVYGLNTLLKYADGDYVCWLSADDVYTVDMLKDSVEFLENNNQYDMVFSDYEIIDENSIHLEDSCFIKAIEELKEGKKYQPYRELLTVGCCIHGCTVLSKKNCFSIEAKFNEDYRYAHDYDLWLHMAARWNVGYIDKIHVKGRKYNWQISQKGYNEIDAINVLFDFIHDMKNFQKLYEKSGYDSINQAIFEVIVGQLKTYKHRDKEFDYLIKKIYENEEKLFKEFWLCDYGKKIKDIIFKCSKKVWTLSEQFFENEGKDSYIEVLCKVNNIDAFLINNQAIRFNRFQGNSLERFNKGLMRKNDIIIGTVKKKILLNFIDNNKQQYISFVKNNDKDYLRIGISYFMYKNTNIVDELQMKEIIDTNQDIWWQIYSNIIE